MKLITIEMVSENRTFNILIKKVKSESNNI